jgi:hypothetical protein
VKKGNVSVKVDRLERYEREEIGGIGMGTDGWPATDTTHGKERKMVVEGEKEEEGKDEGSRAQGLAGDSQGVERRDRLRVVDVKQIDQ